MIRLIMVMVLTDYYVLKSLTVYAALYYGQVLACMCLHVSAHVRAVCLLAVAVVES